VVDVEVLVICDVKVEAVRPDEVDVLDVDFLVVLFGDAVFFAEDVFDVDVLVIFDVEVVALRPDGVDVLDVDVLVVLLDDADFFAEDLLDDDVLVTFDVEVVVAVGLDDLREDLPSLLRLTFLLLLFVAVPLELVVVPLELVVAVPLELALCEDFCEDPAIFVTAKLEDLGA